MTDAAGSDMILTAVAIIFITAIAFVIAYFVGSLSTLEKQDYPAVLSVDKHKVENCLSLDEKILDFNRAFLGFYIRKRSGFRNFPYSSFHIDVINL